MCQYEVPGTSVVKKDEWHGWEKGGMWREDIITCSFIKNK